MRNSSWTAKIVRAVIVVVVIFCSLMSRSRGQDFETGVIEDKWCPPQCDCFNYFETVDCSRRSLAFLPRQSRATRRLYLESNQLEEIPENAFSTVDKLSVLILENNRLAFLSTASFCNLNELQELDVGSNQLTLFKVQLTPDQTLLDSWYQSSQESSTPSAKLERDTSSSHSSSSSSSQLDANHDFLNPPGADYLDSKIYLDTNQTNEASNESSVSSGVMSTLPGSNPAQDFVNFSQFNYEGTNADEANRNYDDFLSDRITSKATECKAKSLREVNLSHNQLRSIPYGLAWFAPNLEILNLAYNQITTARLDSSYSLMTSLRYLDLSRNDIRHLKQNDFEAFKRSKKSSLETINLSDCGLLQIDPLTFCGLNSLTSLTLARSLVNKTLLEVVFSSFPADNKMTRLDLSETFLTNLTVRMVSNFKNLVSLLASYCDLELIESGVFESLPNLETLHLEGGQLTRLPNVASLKKLRRLSLHLNQMSELILSGITSLEYIDLSYNKFSSLRAGWISGSDQIAQLNMSHNQLTSVNNDLFSSISSISTLDLSHNALSMLNTLGPLKVTNMDVSHNRLSAVDDSFFDVLHQTLTNLDLSSNQFTQFRSVFKSFHQLQTLSLASNKLGGAFKSGKLGNLMESLQLLQVLDLSYNGISVLHAEHLVPLRHLSTLLLQGNQIRDIRDTGLESMRILAKLVVSGNQLHTLDAQVFRNVFF